MSHNPLLGLVHRWLCKCAMPLELKQALCQGCCTVQNCSSVFHCSGGGIVLAEHMGCAEGSDRDSWFRPCFSLSGDNVSCTSGYFLLFFLAQDLEMTLSKSLLFHDRVYRSSESSHCPVSTRTKPPLSHFHFSWGRTTFSTGGTCNSQSCAEGGL